MTAPESASAAIDPAARGREELREFLEAISGFGSGAGRRSRRVLPARVRSRRAVIVVCFALSLAGVIYQGRPRRAPGELPADLQGAWTTTNKEYADRGFWIGKHQVAFRVGKAGDVIEVYPVTHLDSTMVRGDTTVYEIEYAVDGGSNHWTIRRSGVPHQTIVFVHQPQMEWSRVADPQPPIR